MTLRLLTLVLILAASDARAQTADWESRLNSVRQGIVDLQNDLSHEIKKGDARIEARLQALERNLDSLRQQAPHNATTAVLSTSLESLRAKIGPPITTYKKLDYITGPSVGIYSAVAYSTVTGSYGTIWNYPTEAEANAAALANCHAADYNSGHPIATSQCQARYWARYGCVVWATGGLNAGWGGGQSLTFARSKALQECSKFSPTCVIEVHACSSGAIE